MSKLTAEKTIHNFLQCTNAFDVDAALQLFSLKAVIDDVSVGRKFKNTAGVREYLETYFVGYHTVTKLESLSHAGNTTKARVDFTGDFGHETGVLNFAFNDNGMIVHIDANLD